MQSNFTVSCSKMKRRASIQLLIQGPFARSLSLLKVNTWRTASAIDESLGVSFPKNQSRRSGSCCSSNRPKLDFSAEVMARICDNPYGTRIESNSRAPLLQRHNNLAFSLVTVGQPRSCSIFLISPIALAGFRPFGQAFVQFMIVWQR